MNELMIFNNPEFGEIRTITENGKTLFCGSDVAKALGYKRPNDAITAHCKGTVKRRMGVQTGMKADGSPATQQVEMLFIPEGDIYRLAARSELPGADAFERWIFDEVLPSIRKTGSYSKCTSSDINKAVLAEAKLNNSRARLASMWLKLAKENPIPEYRQICAHYASTVLAGKEVLPLPEAVGPTYTATEVGEMLGGISANRVGRIANKNGLKVPEFGVQVWDKSPNSSKQIPTWRYNDKAVEKMRSLLHEEANNQVAV